MARPLNADRRAAILTAATHVIAAEGLGASTAAIAKAAGVSNGSLFTYFDTKSAVVNELFVELKTEMGAPAVDALATAGTPRDQVRQMYNGWLAWAAAYPEKRRALAQLSVSEEITAESHRSVAAGFGGVAELLNRSRADGPMKDAPLQFVLELMTAVAEATIDSIVKDPSRANENRKLGFDALWRIIA